MFNYENHLLFECWDACLNLIKTIAALATAIAAFMVYFEFQNREIKKKQIELVLQFIRTLQSNQIAIKYFSPQMGVDSNTNTLSSSTRDVLGHGLIWSLSPNFSKLHNTQYDNVDLIFTDDYIKELNLDYYFLNPLMPKNIIDKMKISFPQLPIPIPLPGTKHFCVVEILNKDSHRFYLDTDTTYHKSEVQISTYLLGMNEVLDVTRKWLNKQGVDNINVLQIQN